MIVVFLYIGDEYTKAEKVLLTLYQTGAMAQSDLLRILSWSDYTLSRTITSINGGGKKKSEIKIGEFIENVGVKNSGKIRFLTSAGLEAISGLIGVEPPKKMLNEGELRVTAQLARVAMKYADDVDKDFFGHYMALTHFKQSITEQSRGSKYTYTIPSPITVIETNRTYDDVPQVAFLFYVAPAVVESIFVQTCSNYRSITIGERGGVFQKSTRYSNTEYSVVAVCQTKEQRSNIIEIMRHYKNLSPLHFRIQTLNSNAKSFFFPE